MDENFTRKIIDLKCTKEELEKFNNDTDGVIFKVNKSFEKNYDLNAVLNAIEECKKGNIDKEYLSRWATAYDGLLSCGTLDNADKKRVTLKQIVAFNISCLLDSLSFFDDTDDIEGAPTLDDYIKDFNSLDYFYKISENCKTWYYGEKENEYGEQEYVFLGENDDDKVYFCLKDRFYLEDLEVAGTHYLTDGKEITQKELKEIESALKKSGYKKLKYGNF